MNLSNFAEGRDNNFNLIRIAAAFAVLVTHSFALAIGTGDAEPLRNTLGITIGSIAVDVFFVTSGFLVTQSLFSRQSTIEFLWSRILRIWPALIVMLLITVFGLGLYFTTLPWIDYLLTPQTYKYLVKNAVLLWGVNYNLPGVFDNNPYKGAINGSLWTLPNEIYMYLMLVVTWAILRFSPAMRLSLLKMTIVIYAFASGVIVLLGHLNVIYESTFAHLFFMFFSGACFFVLKERIVISRTVFRILIVSLVASTIDKQTFFFVYVFTISYILFYTAYVPTGTIRKYNLMGDYSYGVYIYAYPVQQSIAALIPGVSVFSMLLISATITFLLAVFSWHIVEKHALGLKISCAKATRDLLRSRNCC